MKQRQLEPQNATQNGGWPVLAAIAACAAFTWLVVLPWLAGRPALQRRIEFLESRQIDPSAMFYTELENIDRVLDRLERFQRNHPTALWRLSQNAGRQASFGDGSSASPVPSSQ